MRSPAQGRTSNCYWMQSARSGRAARSAAHQLPATQQAHLVPRNLRNRWENAPSRDRLRAAAGPGANSPRAEAGGCRAREPEGGGSGGPRLGERVGEGRAYISPVRG